MATTPDVPVLTLSTKDTRPKIDIDGTLYPFRIVMEDIPWLKYFHHAKQYERCGQLLAKKARTQDETAELETLLPALVEALVDAPKKVLQKLTNDQRWSVVMVFSVLRPTSPRAGAHTMLAAIERALSATRTSGKSALGSRGSTAARRGTGSLRHH